MTTISAPQLSISVPCLNCGTAVIVKASLTRAVSRSGIFCPDCLPSKQKPAPAVWTEEAYEDYLKTEHWQRFRAKALKHYGRKCYLCNATDCQLELHHNTYERRGRELLSDVIPLCRTCHQWHEDCRKAAEL